MDTIGRLWRRLMWIAKGARFDRELDEEMRQHLECRVRDAMDAGMTEPDARAAAGRRFGGALQARECSRDVWGLTWAVDFVQDLRYGARLLRRDPAFTCVAILSLALGIGGNAAVFGLLDAVVYRPLPVQAPHELVLFGARATIGSGYGVQGGERSLYSFNEYRELRDRFHALAGMYAVSEAPGESNITIDGGMDGAERARGTFVSGAFFTVLGVSPRVGRLLTPADDTTPGGHPVAVISDAYWERRFLRDARVLGRTIRVGHAALIIIGVAAEGFLGDHVGQRTDFWVPLTMQAQVLPNRAWFDNPLSLWLRIVGRLRPGQTTAQAGTALNVTFQQILADRAGAVTDETRRRSLREQRITLTSAVTGVSTVRNRFQDSLRVVMWMVALVLLVACTNLATLMLARATARQQELGMRLALGAGRTRLLRQMLTESLLLAVLGALGGLGVAKASGSLLLRMASGGPEPIPLALPMDLRLLAFTGGVTAIAALLVGFLPAWRVSRNDPRASLQAGRVPGDGRTWLSGRRMLVALQLAVTLVLLVAAGLLAVTLRNLANADLGFDRSVVQVEVDAVAAGYEGARLVDLASRLCERLRRVPGVASVSLSSNGLFTGSDSAAPITVTGDRPRSEDDQMAGFDLVSPGYFRTLGVPVVAGREFTERDLPGAPRAAVINETMARYYFGGGNPVGRQFSIASPVRAQPVPYTIVGVARDMKERGLRDGATRRFFLAYAQAADVDTDLLLQLQLARSAGPVAPAVRAAIHEIDPALEMLPIQSLEESYARGMVRDRLTARLATTFGLLAVFLAATGLYGVLAYSVARRTKEIGVRMALGAGRREIARLVLRDGGTMMLVGAGVGLPVAWLASRAVASLLVGVSPFDPAVVAGAVGVLVLVALLAAYVPARHAASLDPLVALRRE